MIYVSLYMFISLQVSSGRELSQQVRIQEVEVFCVSMGINVQMWYLHLPRKLSYMDQKRRYP